MTLILAYTPVGTYTGHPTLAEAVADLRQDLFDRAQNMPLLNGVGAAQRWADDDLVRALDRAVDEYSFVAPLIGATMAATLPLTRSYAFPPGAWWIESVEYPSGTYAPILVPFEESVTPSLGTPATAPAVADTGVSGPLTGTYSWSVSFVKSGGETLTGPASAALTLAGHTAALGAIPTGPPGTVGRNIYRTRAGSPSLLASQILDNMSTAWTDGVSDGALGAAAPSTDTTANLRQFTLKLSAARVPQDTSGVMTVTYAAKHQLTAAGTSLAEQHHDVIILGAAAYAMLAYQAPTNDLFEYQDGEMRDRVDERDVAGHWLAAGQRALTDFQARLETIKRARNAGVAAISQWGDVPVRWDRI